MSSKESETKIAGDNEATLQVIPEPKDEDVDFIQEDVQSKVSKPLVRSASPLKTILTKIAD